MSKKKKHKKGKQKIDKSVTKRNRHRRSEDIDVVYPRFGEMAGSLTLVEPPGLPIIYEGGKSVGRKCTKTSHETAFVKLNEKTHIWGGTKHEIEAHVDLLITLNDWGTSNNSSNEAYARGVPLAVKELLDSVGLLPTPQARINLPIKDMTAPPWTEAQWLALVQIVRSYSRVGVSCQAGHGRTGTFLAALLHFAGLRETAVNVLEWLRDNYCEKAVESETQMNYLKALGVKVGELKPSMGVTDTSTMTTNYGQWPKWPKGFEEEEWVGICANCAHNVKAHSDVTARCFTCKCMLFVSTVARDTAPPCKCGHKKIKHDLKDLPYEAACISCKCNEYKLDPLSEKSEEQLLEPKPMEEKTIDQIPYTKFCSEMEAELEDDPEETVCVCQHALKTHIGDRDWHYPCTILYCACADFSMPPDMSA